MDHGKKERQKLDLAIENIQRASDIWNEDILSIKCCKKRKRQEHISTMLIKQCVSTIKYLQKYKILTLWTSDIRLLTSIRCSEKQWIKSSNNNVILIKFKNKIYFGYYIHLQLCYKQYKIKFYFTNLTKFLKTLKCRHIKLYSLKLVATNYYFKSGQKNLVKMESNTYKLKLNV